MAFSILTWWHRKRVQSEVQFSGRAVHVHRVTNPYHAVSIKARARIARRQRCSTHRGVISL